MIKPVFTAVLRQIVISLQDSEVNRAVTGSLGQALQGVAIEPQDIDVQTDEEGAYEIERHFSAQVSRKVRFSTSGRIRSHFGALLIEGVQVEIMGAVQKRQPDGTWEAVIDPGRYRRIVSFAGLQVPVLALEYEAQAYQKLGRLQRAEMLRRVLQEEQDADL
jgi:hypothetical protein